VKLHVFRSMPSPPTKRFRENRSCNASHLKAAGVCHCGEMSRSFGNRVCGCSFHESWFGAESHTKKPLVWEACACERHYLRKSLGPVFQPTFSVSLQLRGKNKCIPPDSAIRTDNNPPISVYPSIGPLIAIDERCEARGKWNFDSRQIVSFENLIIC
jgi:hypothetical protein